MEARWGGSVDATAALGLVGGRRGAGDGLIVGVARAEPGDMARWCPWEAWAAGGCNSAGAPAVQCWTTMHAATAGWCSRFIRAKLNNKARLAGRLQVTLCSCAP